MGTYRTDKFGRTIIAPNNKVGKDGFTGDEIGGRPPKPPPKEPQGDPEEAKKFMRALGMNNLADMYETNGNAAKDGKLPPFFQGHPYAGAIQNAQQTEQGNVKILSKDELIESMPSGQNFGARGQTATVGDDSRTKRPPKLTVAQIDQGDGTLPLANELEAFASYNNIFTFGCISPEELNFPDDSYRKTGLRSGQIVLRSGGGLDGTQKPRTFAEQHYNIDTQYFIDNVDIETVIAPNKNSRMTNFHNLSFEVREPYSMGQLLQTMQLCAINAGYSNYLEAPWLLSINFIGWQDLDNDKPGLASSRKLLPCKIVSVDFNVDTEGSIYRFSCSAYNDEAFTDGAQSLPCNVTLYGGDLEEITQSGIGSLATALNTFILKAQASQKDKVEMDEYIFCYPQETSSAQHASLFKGQSASMTGTATTGDEYIVKEGLNYKGVNVKTNEYGQFQEGAYHPNERKMGIPEEKLQKDYVNSLLGYSIKRGKLSETIKKTIANRDAGINGIGKNKIAPENPLASGDSPFGNAEFVLNTKTETMDRGGTSIDPKRRTIQFRAGTPIQRVLEELVLLSDFGQSVLTKDLQNKKGEIPWFRIEADLYIVEDQEAEKKNGRMPRIYVYKVLPYKVNSQFFKMPNDPPAGYNKLVREAAKAYNYMYTGLNKDILEFDIKFENAFYKSISSDIGNNSGSNKPSEQSDSKKSPELELQGKTKGPQASTKTNIQLDNKLNASNEFAGGMTESPAVRVAREFNESLANSDVDLVTMTIKILGDPYYIADSGMGNYNSESTVLFNVNKDGTINHQNGTVDVLLNFLTPIDIDPEAGDYKMDGPAVGVSNFSGLYMVIGVKNSFAGNLFTQELELVKRNNFELKDLDTENKDKVVKFKDTYAGKVAAAEKDFGKNTPQYDFAVADSDADGKLNSSEYGKAGLSFEDAVKLSKEASKPKPAQPKIAKNAQIDADVNYQREAFGSGTAKESTKKDNVDTGNNYGPT